MLAFTHPETNIPRREAFQRAPREVRKPDLAHRVLARGEVLFQTGDTRSQIYRVERGALCHYRHLDDGGHEIIEFAFPGDMVGFGHIESHVSTAQAIAETVVSLVPATEFEEAVEANGELASRVAAAADREFEYVRARALASARAKPVQRVALFLSALSHISAREGRDPALVTDELSSGFVAEHLDLSIDALTGALRELETRGMVRATSSGLEIADLKALEKFARAA
jgi:CRP/FNR family transcriptional regulator